MTLRDKIEAREAVVAVIGLGYVGLPLAVAFAEAGFHVIGIDIDADRVTAINRGQSYVSDVPTETLAAVVGRGSSNQYSVSSDRWTTNELTKQQANQPTQKLTATTDYGALHDADAVIICVPTPLGKTKDPDMSYIISATDHIAQRLHAGMLVVLESTTYPGTTEELILPRLSRTRVDANADAPEQGFPKPGDGRSNEPASGPALTVGRDFYLAFSPERIDPGRRDYTVHNTPKVIGGMTRECTGAAAALYGAAIDRIVPVSSPRAAEMVKLLENTFRAVNIALVNEVAIMCDRLDIDVWEVIEAAKTKPFGFMPFYPGPGLGGHCIPIDPEYLAWKLKTLNYNARFIQLASEINFGMPEYVVDKVTAALNDACKAINGSRILILGVAYKADVGDLRESPALDIIHRLQEKGADITYHDPYVPHLDRSGIMLDRVGLDSDALQQADCVVITTDHSSYDWRWIVDNSRLIVDTRNATRGVGVDRAHVIRL